MFDLIGKTFDLISSEKLAIIQRVGMILGILLLLYVLDQYTQYSKFFYLERQLDLIEKTEKLLQTPNLSVAKKNQYELIRINLLEKRPALAEPNDWISLLTSGGYFFILGLFFFINGLLKLQAKKGVDWIMWLSYLIITGGFFLVGVGLWYLLKQIPIIYDPLFNYALNVVLQASVLSLVAQGNRVTRQSAET